MPRELLLNVTPIRYECESIEVELFPYESHEQLKVLREKHGDTHVFRRNDKHIQCVARSVDALFLGGEKSVIELAKNLKLVASLTQDAMLSWLAKKGLLSEKFDPLIVVGKDNFLESHSELSGFLSIRNRVSISVRQFQFDRKKPFVGISWDTSTERSIDADCAQLHDAGIDLLGLYVQTTTPGRDPRLQPVLRVVGRIATIEDGVARLDDVRDDGIVEYALSELHLEPRFDGFDRCFDSLLGKRALRAREALESKLTEERKGRARLQMVDSILGWIRKQKLEFAPSADFEIGDLLSEGESKQFPGVLQLQGPTYVFDPSGNRTNQTALAGLSKHGPYSRQVFTPSAPKVCVVCEKSRRGQVEVFLNKFLNGVQIPGKMSPYENGFARTYHLHSVDVTFFEANGPSAEAFYAAASEAMVAATDSRWDLALIQTTESTHALAPQQNPYLVAKALFLTNSITSQAFEIETTTMAPYNLAYTLSNMALACYAKLNGTPWRITSNQGIAHEIIVGMGSASIGDGRFGTRERVVGITSVFLSDGEYVLSNLSRAVPLEEYGDTLIKSLRETFARVREDLNWRERDAVRIIVHAFKPMRDVQVEAIKTAISELGNFDVEYAFLHVKEFHPYLLLDLKSEGKFGKGEWVPPRGVAFQLTPYQYVLTVTGVRELKRQGDGMPRPLLLELHSSSTFRDMLYLSRQALWFASHSWRSFQAAHMPVTVLYSDQVAKLLGKLDKLGRRWNPDVMLGRIGTTRWFL
ncbi:hypothetical protein J2777_001260 [Paraburkholderia graminis]|uniref:argonaute/piwi family protein n=1 Tax=Paraburkholderia graminis TaxID=60548 RepID=UPI00285F1EBC|nr:hypothetical protein [Paraburkholderia graminis]MDR6467567.1 hypothetical protein [Paraburkholderia graminis]